MVISAVGITECAVYILYSKISTDPGLLKIRHSHRFVAVVIQFLITQILRPKQVSQRFPMLTRFQCRSLSKNCLLSVLTTIKMADCIRSSLVFGNNVSSFSHRGSKTSCFFPANLAASGNLTRNNVPATMFPSLTRALHRGTTITSRRHGSKLGPGFKNSPQFSSKGCHLVSRVSHFHVVLSKGIV